MVALGLGGNLGDPISAMGAVISAFDADDATQLLAVSKVYRTPPWGKLDQPDFYNACILIGTGLDPLQLLDRCLSLELSLKRERIERWGPRTIDIDLLLYGEEAIESERLTVPHPRMHERAFVLMPLADIAADRMFKGQSVVDWLSETDKNGIEPVSLDGEWWRDHSGS